MHLDACLYMVMFANQKLLESLVYTSTKAVPILPAVVLENMMLKQRAKLWKTR